MGDIHPVEVSEVITVNCLSPFFIVNHLKPLMMVQPELPKFIVNVSAVEGKFSWKVKKEKYTSKIYLWLIKQNFPVMTQKLFIFFSHTHFINQEKKS